jgi:carboxymethylenebutenolidase
MGLKVEAIRYGAEANIGYFAFPERVTAPLPAVVVLQEAWGVDAHIEDVTRRFAFAGYAAFAPDLYARGGERPAALRPERLAELQAFMNTAPTIWRDPAAREAELAKRPGAERARIEESFGEMASRVGNLEPFVPSVLSATRWLREECNITRGQKIGSVGFCMGGGLSALVACCDPAHAAAVVFYGSSPAATLVSRIRCHVLGLYGALDDRVNAQVPAFEEAMGRTGKRFEKVIYQGASHAFFNDGRPTYNADASRDAFVRTLQFLRSELAS